MCYRAQIITRLYIALIKLGVQIMHTQFVQLFNSHTSEITPEQAELHETVYNL